MVRRCVPALAGLVALVLALGGCGGSSSDGGGEGGGASPKSIGASLYSRDVPYYQAIASGLEAQSKAYGWDLNLVFSRPDPAEQIDAIDTLLARQPDGLVIVPVDGTGLIPAAQRALAQDVPVVSLGDSLSDPKAQTTYVGSDYADYGRQKAQWIVDRLHGRGKVAVIHGIRGITFSEDQWDGAKEVFARHPGIEVVNGPYAGGFTADLGLTATQNLLTANPDVDAIFFDNDDLALGGVRAAKDRDIDPGDILLVGTDGLDAGLSAVRDGDLDYTLSQCAFEQGREAIRVLHRMLVDDQDPRATVLTRPFAVTPENVDAYSPEKSC